MDDLEEIRQRRLRELQERQASAYQDQAGAQEAEARSRAAAQQDAIERLLQQVLEPEARERLTRIRMSRPELADAVTRTVVGAVQQGQLKGRISDEDLRGLLARLQPEDRDIKITRK